MIYKEFSNSFYSQNYIKHYLTQKFSKVTCLEIFIRQEQILHTDSITSVLQTLTAAFSVANKVFSVPTGVQPGARVGDGSN